MPGTGWAEASTLRATRTGGFADGFLPAANDRIDRGLPQEGTY
jgi:hypothetical protein